MIGTFLSKNSDLFLVGGVLGVLLILFAPIPTMMLDFMIILNFSFGMTILMLTFYVGKPVEFSTFPSLLLVATLFRLSLNVAATRLILTQGYAGEVINAVGSFAVQGNFVIGLVVFFILIVVQYVVVTAGAQRVSEVAARFVLDSVPGHQMSIDADLNMGLIDQTEAKKRRRELEKEAAFYGAMDGASKFVKGDAVAGIIIVLINIIAGWIIGMVQHDMDWSEALQKYTLLTIGDGIVTQVPGLIISVATGIIVTRSSADRQLSTEVFSQLTSVPKIPLIIMAALVILFLMPGMPKWPIAILLMVFASAWVSARSRRLDKAEATRVSEDETAKENEGQAAPSPIGILLGKELGEAWQPLRTGIADRLAALRRQTAERTGFLLPQIVVTDGAELSAFEYAITLFGADHARGTLIPEQTLAIGTPAAGAKLTGTETRDPAFGLPALWVDEDQKEAARSAGLTLVDPVTIMITHLTEIVRSEAALLLSRQDVVGLLEGTRQRQPGLVEELIPAIMSMSDVQRVLQNLLSEDISIRTIDLICEILVDVGRQTKDMAELTELVRQRLSHVICSQLRGRHDQLAVLSLDPRIEAQIDQGVKQGQSGATYIIEPRLAETLLKKIMPMVESMMHEGLSPVLLCGPTIRQHLRTFLRRSVPRLSVISVNEVPQNINLRSFGILKTDQV